MAASTRRVYAQHLRATSTRRIYAQVHLRATSRTSIQVLRTTTHRSSDDRSTKKPSPQVKAKKQKTQFYNKTMPPPNKKQKSRLSKEGENRNVAALTPSEVSEQKNQKSNVLMVGEPQA
jgi:hypothetical protein